MPKSQTRIKKEDIITEPVFLYEYRSKLWPAYRTSREEIESDIMLLKFQIEQEKERSKSKQKAKKTSDSQRKLNQTVNFLKKLKPGEAPFRYWYTLECEKITAVTRPRLYQLHIEKINKTLEDESVKEMSHSLEDYKNAFAEVHKILFRLCWNCLGTIEEEDDSNCFGCDNCGLFVHEWCHMYPKGKEPRQDDENEFFCRVCARERGVFPSAVLDVCQKDVAKHKQKYFEKLMKSIILARKEKAQLPPATTSFEDVEISSSEDEAIQLKLQAKDEMRKRKRQNEQSKKQKKKRKKAESEDSAPPPPPPIKPGLVEKTKSKKKQQSDSSKAIKSKKTENEQKREELETMKKEEVLQLALKKRREKELLKKKKQQEKQKFELKKMQEEERKKQELMFEVDKEEVFSILQKHFLALADESAIKILKSERNKIFFILLKCILFLPRPVTLEHFKMVKEQLELVLEDTEFSNKGVDQVKVNQSLIETKLSLQKILQEPLSRRLKYNLLKIFARLLGSYLANLELVKKPTIHEYNLSNAFIEEVEKKNFETDKQAHKANIINVLKSFNHVVKTGEKLHKEQKSLYYILRKQLSKEYAQLPINSPKALSQINLFCSIAFYKGVKPYFIAKPINKPIPKPLASPKKVKPLVYPYDAKKNAKLDEDMPIPQRLRLWFPNGTNQSNKDSFIDDSLFGIQMRQLKKLNPKITGFFPVDNKCQEVRPDHIPTLEEDFEMGILPEKQWFGLQLGKDVDALSSDSDPENI
eukprot:augustus_masked-scaffold_77-processed-gene-0.13-mRNA-1 protein AED:1.00 eAED:1.00 QI:0/-1/0/0/-1/1/1/0/755